jgi:hypothetical protein
MDLIRFVRLLPEESFQELREAVNTRLGLVNSELTDGEKEVVREKSRVIECIKAVRVRTGWTRFVARYRQAVENKEPEFEFEGNSYVTGFAKHFVKFHGPKFTGKGKQ